MTGKNCPYLPAVLMLVGDVCRGPGPREVDRVQETGRAPIEEPDRA